MEITKEEFIKVAAKTMSDFMDNADDSRMSLMVATICTTYAGMLTKRLFDKSEGKA